MNVIGESKRLKSVLFIVVISSLAGCLYGLDLGAISGALHFVAEEMKLTVGQQGMIVGAVLGGGSIAILITGILADIFGRKKMIIISGLIFSVGVVLTALSYNYATLLWGRIMGIGVGISSILIPLYLSESAPAHIRGRAITCFQLFLTGGILLAYLIDLAFVKTGNWRAMFGVLIFPGLLFFLGSFFIPESPTWLYMKGCMDKSKNSLLRFHSEAEVSRILMEMNLLTNKSVENLSDSVLRKKYIIPFIIGLAVASLTQTTGVNSILQYAPTILSEAGVKSQSIAVAVGSGVTLINFLFTIIALMLIDRLGRKPLLIFSSGSVSIFLILLGIASLLPNSSMKILMLTIGMFGFVFSYSVGIGVVVWLAMSELLPTKIRAKGLAICLFANSMISTVIAAVFPGLILIIGYSGMFFILAGFTICYFIIALFFVPETKGKTIEEIELYFQKKYIG
jgi:MFS transporter, SP family, galactose:H+ symporter